MMRSWIHFSRGRVVRQARVGLGDLREEHLSRQGFQGPVAMLYRTDTAPLGGYFYYDDSAANAQPNAVLLIQREFFPIGTVAFTDATRLLMLDSEHYDLG